MEETAALGVPMCRPLEFGVSDEGVYSIQSWIEGADAEECIPSMGRDEQYRYGMQAGRILKQIHAIPAPPETEDWERYFNRKVDFKVQKYRECPLQYANGQALLEYIRANRHLLKGRPSVFQHGDYHIGNMMIGADRRLFIIDFNRCDFGDPWEEFNRIVWSAQAAPAFATGLVDGYFARQIPPDFWKLLALYISSNTLSSLPWAIPFGQEQVRVMLRQAEDVLRWYDNMQNPIPTWYQAVPASPGQG